MQTTILNNYTITLKRNSFLCKMVLFVLLIAGNSLSAQTYSPPAYTGGPYALTSYIGNYVALYPYLPGDKEYIETYTYTLLISKNGAVKFVNVLGKDIEIRTEIKRVLRLCDKWQPANLNGAPIDTIYSGILKICSNASEKGACSPIDTTITLQYYSNVIVGSGMSVYTKSNTEIYLYNEGRTYFEKGDYPKAIEKFKKAIAQKYRPLKDPLFNLAVCYVKLNDQETACKYFLEAARYTDNDAEKYYKQYCK